jgi:hypothetical protein
MFRLLACALAPLVVSAAACSSSSSNDPDPGALQDTVSNLAITAHFTPDPPVVGEDTVLHIRVEDLDGNPQVGAVVTVDPQMPMMGHGSTAEATVTEDDEAGDYTATPVLFNMPGEWEVTIDVLAGDETGQLVKKLTL